LNVTREENVQSPVEDHSTINLDTLHEIQPEHEEEQEAAPELQSETIARLVEKAAHPLVSGQIGLGYQFASQADDAGLQGIALSTAMDKLPNEPDLDLIDTWGELQDAGEDSLFDTQYMHLAHSSLDYDVLEISPSQMPALASGLADVGSADSGGAATSTAYRTRKRQTPESDNPNTVWDNGDIVKVENEGPPTDDNFAASEAMQESANDSRSDFVSVPGAGLLPKQPLARLEAHPVLGRLHLPGSALKRSRRHTNTSSGTDTQNPSPVMSVRPTDGEDTDASLNKKRVVWTPELHDRFVKAVKVVGIHQAAPKTLIQVMNVEGLTSEHVKSHLQKYRNSLKKQSISDVKGSVPSRLVMAPPMQVSTGDTQSSLKSRLETNKDDMRATTSKSAFDLGPLASGSTRSNPSNSENRVNSFDLQIDSDEAKEQPNSPRIVDSDSKQTAPGASSYNVQRHIERQLEMQERTMQLQLEMQMMVHRTVSLQRKLQLALERQSFALQKSGSSSELDFMKEHQRLIREQREMQVELEKQQTILKLQMEEQEVVRQQLLKETSLSASGAGNFNTEDRKSAEYDR